jgi:hypothetical protein
MKAWRTVLFWLLCCSAAVAQTSSTSISAQGSYGYISGSVSGGPDSGDCYDNDEGDDITVELNVENLYLCYINGASNCSGQTDPTQDFLSPGTYQVSGGYSGYQGVDSNGNPCGVAGSSATENVVVPAFQSTISAQGPFGSLQAGQTLSVAVGLDDNIGAGFGPYPTGGVTLYFGQTALASAGLDGYGATISQSTKGIAPGTYPVYVDYSGDSNFTSVASSPFLVTIEAAQLASSTALKASLATIVEGGTETFSATVNRTGNVTPTGTVTLMSGNKVIGKISLTNGKGSVPVPADYAPGSYSLQAVYGGDSFNLPSTSSKVSITIVAQTATTTTITVNPSTVTQGQTTKLTAIVTPVIGNVTPTGTVTINSNGVPVSTLPLVDGVASLQISTTSIAPGTYSVTGNYSGSETATASSTSSTVTLTVLVASTVSVTASPNPVAKGSITTLTATVKNASGDPVTSGTVTFSYAGTTLGKGALNSSGQATLPIATGSFSEGTYMIQAAFSGSGSVPAATGTVSVVVN